MSKSIFISYRRDGGEVMAQLLYDRLVTKGFSVFYDIESLKSGPFDTKLYQEIEAADYILVILPPQGLDRCRYEEDWVRQEIRHALRLGKPIVPVMMRGFEFPANLPDDIAGISRCNGVRFDDMNYLDAKINKIIDLFEVSVRDTVVDMGNSQKRGGPSLISNVCSIGALDANDLWPKGKYSAIVSLDVYNVIFFHATLREPAQSQKMSKVGYCIYDEDGVLVIRHEMQINFMPGNDRFSVGWIIRGSDGSFVKAGKYRAELWYENSRVYEYYFMITSQEQEAVLPKTERHPKGNVQQKEQTSGIVDQITLLEKRLSRPTGFLYAMLMLSGFLLVLWGSREDVLAVAALGGVMCLVFCNVLIIYTKRYVTQSGILAFILSVFLFWFYTVYLFVASIQAMMNAKEWKAELQKLKAIV